MSGTDVREKALAIKPRAFALKPVQIRLHGVQDFIHHRMHLGARYRRAAPLLMRLKGHECAHRSSPSSRKGNIRGGGNRLDAVTMLVSVHGAIHTVPMISSLAQIRQKKTSTIS